ncbi:hypothetical protein M427DRAFT_310338, partial [Gonapodya prolifera JEL478]
STPTPALDQTAPRSRSTHTRTTSSSWRLSLASLHPSLAASLVPASTRPSTPAAHPTCAICLTPFIPHSSIVRTLIPCGHVFHRACVDPWVGGRSGTCPVCRGVVGGTRGTQGVGGVEGQEEREGGGEDAGAGGAGRDMVQGEVRLAIDQ